MREPLSLSANSQWSSRVSGSRAIRDEGGGWRGGLELLMFFSVARLKHLLYGRGVWSAK